MSSKPKKQIAEVLPKNGLVYSERGNLTETLCRPKIVPIKSAALERLESIQNELIGQGEDGDDQ